MTTHWLDDIEHMHDEMEKLSKALIYAPLLAQGENLAQLGRFRHPIVNQFETNDKLVTEVELPGAKKEDIELNVTDDFAEIKVEKKTELEKKDKGFYRCESRCQSFYRKIPFPIEVKAGLGEAAFKDGVLTLTIPKAKAMPDEKARRLEIK